MPIWKIQPITDNNRKRILSFIRAQWGADIVVVHQAVYHPAQLPGFAAYKGNDIIGLVTYQIQARQCELVTLDSLIPSQGLGTCLVQRVIRAARELGCERLFLVTTNDNLNALRFYQKRGFHLSAIYPNTVNQARFIKPEIPLIGNFGIPIRDELELEMDLKNLTEFLPKMD